MSERKILNRVASVADSAAHTLLQCPRLVRKSAAGRKIIYGLSPPPRWANVGDHAQAVAISAWFSRHFPELPVIEFDKDALHLLSALRFFVHRDDVVFLHSGGNLGDRGIWSETMRRRVILRLTDNQIISLPQTIHFSDTEMGRHERENTRRIYAGHSRLSVLARDARSGEIARELFPTLTTFAAPDFVLSLPPRSAPERGVQASRPRVLLCLRVDNESAMGAEGRSQLSRRFPHATVYDTSLSRPIFLHQRAQVLEETLDLFQRHDAVITDRYHGLIFSVLCRLPTVVLPTVDHKLVSAMEWFRDVSFVQAADDLEMVPSCLERVLAEESRNIPDFNALYFDRIASLVEGT